MVPLGISGPRERSEMLEKLATKQQVERNILNKRAALAQCTFPTTIPTLMASSYLKVVSSSCSVAVREQAAATAAVDWNFGDLATDGCMPSDLSKRE